MCFKLMTWETYNESYKKHPKGQLMKSGRKQIVF